MGVRLLHVSSVASLGGKGGREPKGKAAPKAAPSKPTPPPPSQKGPSPSSSSSGDGGGDDNDGDNGGSDDLDDDDGGGGGGKGKDFASQLARQILFAKRELGKLRGSSVSADLLDGILVQAYGEMQPLKDLAQVALRGPTQLVVSPFDAALCGAIGEAIRASDLGLNPQEEGGTMLRVPVPKPSKETREAATKQVSKIAEQAKVRVRRVRSGALDKVKKAAGGAGVSEDELKREGDSIEAAAAAATAEVAKMAEVKRKEIEAGL